MPLPVLIKRRNNIDYNRIGFREKAGMDWKKYFLSVPAFCIKEAFDIMKIFYKPFLTDVLQYKSRNFLQAFHKY